MMPDIKIIFDCGHERMQYRPEGGVSDHFGCDCVSCHPKDYHLSPFKCKDCGGNGISYFTTCYTHPMPCCTDDESLIYHCKQELRREGYLRWHDIREVTLSTTGEKYLRYDCHNGSGASAAVDETRICFSCKKSIDS